MVILSVSSAWSWQISNGGDRGQIGIPDMYGDVVVTYNGGTVTSNIVTLSVLSPQQAILRTSPNYKIVGRKAKFRVDIELEGVQNLTAGEVYLNFDPAIIAVIDAEPAKPGIQIGTGTFPANSQILRNAVSNTKGTIDYAFGLSSGAVSGTGTIATINFKAKSLGSTTLNFVFDTQHNRNTMLIDSNRSLISLEAVAGTTIKVNREYGNIEGYAVLDIGEGLIATTSKIKVTVEKTRSRIMTNQNSFFSLKEILMGTYTLRLEAPGATDIRLKDVQVKASEITSIGTVTLLAGDSNDDGQINFYDFVEFADAFGLYADSGRWRKAEADYNHDGQINILDFAILRDNFGRTQPVAASAQAPTRGNRETEKRIRLAITPQIIDAKVGDVVTVTLEVSGADNFMGGELHLLFNPNILEVVDAVEAEPGTQIIPGDYPAGCWVICNKVDNTKGKISYAAGRINRGNTSGQEGRFAQIKFRVKSTGIATKLSFEFAQGANRSTMLFERDNKGQVYKPALECTEAIINVPTQEEDKDEDKKIQLSIEPANIEAEIGQVVTARVVVSHVTDLTAGKIQISSDPELIEIISMEVVNMPANASEVCRKIDKETGRVEYVFEIKDGKTEFSGELIRIKFRAKRAGRGSLLFELEDSNQTGLVTREDEGHIRTEIESYGAVISIKNNITDFSKAYCYPNPVKDGNSVIFKGLPPNTKIRIFNIAGEKVFEEENINNGTYIWHCEDSTHNKVASGVYLYILTDGSSMKNGKIAIIR